MPDVQADTSIFTKAPAPQNAFQMMGQSQEMAARAQQIQGRRLEIEQQGLQLKAQKALGPLVQQSLDPATGQPDMVKFLGLAASNPDTAFLAPKLIDEAIQRQVTQENQVHAHLENTYKKLEMTSELASAELDREQRGEKITSANAVGFFAKARSMGLMTEDEAMQAVASLKGQDPSSVMRKIALGSARGREAMKQSFEQWKDMNELVQTVDPNTGNKIYVRKKDLVPGGGAITNQSEAAAGSGGYAAQGGQAPLPGAARPGEQPSTPPAAQRGPRPVAIAESPMAGQNVAQYGELQKEINNDAQTATMLQRQIDESRELLKDYKPGKLGPLAMEFANLIRDPRFVMPGFSHEQLTKWADEMMGGGANSAEAAEKINVLAAVNQARQAMGPGSPLRQGEFMRFQQVLPSLLTSPGGLKKIYKYMEQLNKLATTKVVAFEHHKSLGKYDPTDFQHQWDNFMELQGWNKFAKPAKKEGE